MSNPRSTRKVARTSNIGTFFKGLDNDDKVSIELTKQVMDIVDIKQLIESYESIVAPKTQINFAYVKISHKIKNSKGNIIKLKTFGPNSVTSTRTENANKCKINNFEIKSIHVNDVNEISTQVNSIEIVQQYTFDLINNSNWILSIRIIKQMDNPQEFTTKLSEFKTALIGETNVKSMDEISNNSFDFVTTSLEYIGSTACTIQIAQEGLDEVQSVLSFGKDDDDYQFEIFNLAKDIYRDSVTIGRFKRQSGFKKLVSNTVELSRPVYFKSVLPSIEEYYITDKIDGKRAILIIDEIFHYRGKSKTLLGVDIKAISDKVYEISTFSRPKTMKSIYISHTVIDTEMLNEHTFYGFDIIVSNSNKVSNLPFKMRIDHFDSANELLKKYEIGSMKDFVKLTNNYKNEISKFYNDKKNNATKNGFHIDGIIFTPSGTYFKDIKRVPGSRYVKYVNTEYYNTISFKWKPLDQLTIDFYIMKNGTKKNNYALCSGVDIVTFTKLKMQFFDNYIPLKNPNSHQYFPIQFEPYDSEGFTYKWSPSETDLKQCEDYDDLNGLVGEFAFVDKKGNYYDQPKLQRLRVDRIPDVAKGEYYGNALKYSELIWHSIKYPLTLEMLGSDAGSGYFMSDDNQEYAAQRAFNSFVKTHLMQSYLIAAIGHDSANLMDLMCGKGQDLARSIDIGFDEIVAIDKDVDAIYELLQRKYNLKVKTENATANIRVKQMDFEEPSELNIKKLKLKPNSFSAAMNNFGIHYLCHDATSVNVDNDDKRLMSTPLQEFVDLISHYLKSKGRMMITCFNGKTVFDTLGNTNEWSLRENGRVKYSIKSKFASTSLMNLNQAIDVLLPFSNGNYYTEYLVNIEYLESLFTKNGFKVIANDSFGTLFRQFKRENARMYSSLSKEDKQYVSLYQFIIFEKQ